MLAWMKNVERLEKMASVVSGEYVATAPDGTRHLISKGGSRQWDLGMLASDETNETWYMFNLRTLALAKLAGEVAAAHGAEAVRAHRTDCRSNLIGGGWGGWGRVYGSKVTCACGYKSQENVGSMEDARDLAAHHQQVAWETLLDA